MRKYLALALAGIMVVGVVSIANAGEETQIETAKIKPSKLSKKKHQNIKFVNTITTLNAPGSGQPKSGERTIVDFPKQFKFNYKKFPYCKTDAAGLETAPTTEDAVKACGKGSLVSDPKGSSATVTVAGVGEIPVDVSAFNEKNKVLLLYAKPTGAFSGINASILVGKLKKSKSGKKYGRALDVVIPPLAAGAISFFEVTIKKSKYVQAKCKPKKMWFQAQTFFSDGSDSTDDYSLKCKPKRR